MHADISTPVTLIAALMVIPIPQHIRAQRSGDVVAREIPGTAVTFTTVYIAGGSFLLGSPGDEAGRDADEGPRRRVTVDAFLMGAHEVTQAEYGVFRSRRLDSGETTDSARTLNADAVTRPSPPYEDPAHGMGGPEYPAAGMTQLAALRYARWLSEKTGRLYRLPTEAEWEYACRAGDDDAAELRCAARLESTLAWQRRDPQIPKSEWWNTDSPHVGFRLVSPAGEQTLAEIEAYWMELLGPEG